MNITTLLQQLKESIEIDKLNALIKNDVPSETIDVLANRMKKGKYDNKAEAILKAAQSWKDEKGEYLRKNAGRVYAILGVIAKNNSNFNANTVLDSFRKYQAAPKQFDNFWKQEYLKARSGEYHQKPKENFGLKNARVRQTTNFYLYFPKTYKKDGGLGINTEDIDKQYADIKQLAAEMAKRDTSGQTSGIKKATDVHWCVAAPGNEGSFYADYKDEENRGNGLFFIIVKKGDNNVPNWNERYLFFAQKDGGFEFADKFDDHIAPTKVLDKETINLINKISKDVYTVRKNKVSEKQIYDDLINRAANDTHKYRQSLRVPKNLKKIFELFTERANSLSDKGTMKKAIRAIQKVNDELLEQLDGTPKIENLISWFKKHKAKCYETHTITDWYINKTPLSIKLTKNSVYGVRISYVYFKDGRLYRPFVSASKMSELKKKMLKAKNEGVLKAYGGDENNWGDYSDNLTALRYANREWKYKSPVSTNSKIYKGTVKDLKNNKNLINVYNRMLGNTSSPINISLDANSYFRLTNEGDDKKFRITFKKGVGGVRETVGYINDPDIIEKIKKKFEELNRKPKDGEPVRPKKQSDEDLPF